MGESMKVLENSGLSRPNFQSTEKIEATELHHVLLERELEKLTQEIESAKMKLFQSVHLINDHCMFDPASPPTP